MTVTFAGYTDSQGRFRNTSNTPYVHKTPKLHSSIFNKVKSSKLNEHGRNHLHKFADLTKKSAEYTKRKHQERQGQKIANIYNLNEKIKSIQKSNESSNVKIGRYQRLLNDNHKQMDQPMVQTIQRELQDLHQHNGSNSFGNNHLSSEPTKEKHFDFQMPDEPEHEPEPKEKSSDIQRDIFEQELKAQGV